MDLQAGNTKRNLGRKSTAERLDLSGMNGLVSYEPGELILVAQPGIRLSEVEALLAGENQHLAFEPPHWGADATLGGTVGCNLSGPRRFKVGALRDFLLGLEMIDGYGNRIRTGGRVVKNVTGYDICKLMSGSFGTLGVLTEICFKVWPSPETQRTLTVYGLSNGDALRWMLELAALPVEITGLAYLPATTSESSQTYIRVEGSPVAVSAQLEKIASDLSVENELLHNDNSHSLWHRLRELEPYRPGPDEQLWRFSGPPAQANDLVEKLKLHEPTRFGLDWGGGVLWSVFPAAVDASLLHDEALRMGALSWRFASNDRDSNEEPFSPLDRGLHRLNRTIKETFDPHRIFNPERL